MSHRRIESFEKAEKQAFYIQKLLEGRILVFWNDFDAVFTTNRTEAEIDPNCWRAYPYDPDRPIDFYRDRI